MGIKTVEDAIITQIKAGVTVGTGAAHVRQVESLPGDWDADMLKRLLRLVPGVFVVFAGGPVKEVGAETANISSRWSVIVATGHASGEAARRRGDSIQIGAYEILERVIPKLHGHTIADEGTLKLVEVQNLYTGEIDKQGLAIYAATFEMLMALPTVLDEATADEFEKFNVKWDIPPHETAAEHEKWLNNDESTSKPDAKDDIRPEQ